MVAIVIILVMFVESSMQFWVVVWRLAWKSGLDLGTVGTKLEGLGHNDMEASFCMQLGSHSHTLALLCMWLGC